MHRFVRTCSPVVAAGQIVLATGSACAAANVAPAVGAGVASHTAIPATIPLRREASRDGTPGGWGTAVAFVAITACAGAWVLWRRRERSGARPERPSSGGVVRLSSHALTQQASVHAVQWRGEEFLIACNSQQVTLIARKLSDGRDGGQA